MKRKYTHKTSKWALKLDKDLDVLEIHKEESRMRGLKEVRSYYLKKGTTAEDWKKYNIKGR